MKRKILSLILVFAMTVSLLTVGTGAVEPTYGDTAGHWAESSIERWSAYGIIQGSNGQFDPNGQLTCAQLATILAKLLKLPAAKDAGFTDNTAGAWYYDAINRCAAAGILNGNGDGTVTPEAPITRERAMVMLARALGIEPIRKPDLTKYTDAAQVSAYAQGYVAALIEAGIVGGVTADELAPQNNINRASTVTILDRAIGVYADKDGMTVNAKDGELVLVVAKNVKVINAPEGTKIVVADGATGLTVNGKSVSDDQTYIVPKTTTSSGSSSSGGHSHSHSYNETTHKCSCGAFAPAVVATIGNTNGYLTLEAAVAAAQSGDIVKLVKDITLAQRVEASFNGTIDLNGRTLTSTETCKNGSVFHVASGTLTIKNGSMIGVSGPTGWTDELYKKECDAITVANGATVTLEDLSISICSRTGACVYVFDGGKAYITSGTYINDTTEFDANGTTKAMLLNQADNKPQAIFVSGGTFKGENPANGDNSHNPSTFLAAGYKAEGADNIWTVSEDTSKTYCAQVGNGKYETLAAAIEAAQNGDTVKLVSDTTLRSSVEINKSITFDLKGKAIHYTGENQKTANPTMSHRALNVTGGTVTIKNGAITTTVVGTIYPPQDNPQAEGSEFDAIIVKSGAVVTLEDMNITINDKYGSCLYVFEGGKATVKSGSYTNTNTSGDKLLLNQANVDTQLIFVEGGTFSGRNPAEGDDNMGGTFLAEGYKAVENADGTWVVRKKENNAQVGGKNYEELSDAIEASNIIDNTITLTKNTTVKLENGVANGSEKSRNITIKGDGTQTVDVITRAISAEGGMLSYQRGSTFTFKNVTIQAGEGSFDGIVCDELVYNNCIIKGKLTLYGKATFINCTFENEMANQYSIWTWGGTDVRFEDCTFNTNGKAILLYGQATAEKPTNLTVSNCTFNDRNNGSAGKAAIEIGNDYNATYSLTVTSATVNGFADGKNTGSKIWANKNSMDAEHLTVIIDNKYVLGTETPKQTVTVATAEELKEKLTTLTSAGSGNNVINIDGDFQLANGETWTPVTVDGYNGAGVITINGNGHTIKGLNAPLIAGGFAGKSGVVIKDLTLENVTINDTTSDQGIGAFIGNVDSMPQIDLDNCHLINSNITSTDGARVGGLIGWTSGYNNPNDGPVNTCVSITNCSVENCAITAKGSVGAIIGHAGANPATYHTITGCTVKDCTLTSTDDGGWRVGVVVGTANVGEVTIKNITTDNNTVTQTGKTAPEGQSDLYGRFVPGETGKLTIDNIEIK